MKKLTTLWMMMVMLVIALPANAMSRSEVRENARFITDRMAYELNLSQMQYDDAYEVNYDFIDNVRHIMDDVVMGYAPAVDRYYQYLDYRNDDLRWILNASQYRRFMGTDYFYRPIYTTANNWLFRIYRVYTDVRHFYFGKPHHYKSYKGGHYRTHFGHVSYYKTHRKNHYKHDFYHGDVRQLRNPGHHKPAIGPSQKPGKHPGVNHKPKADRRPSAAAQSGRRPSVQRGAAGAPVSSPKADKKADKKKVDRKQDNKEKPAAKPSNQRRQSNVKATGSRQSMLNSKSDNKRNSGNQQRESSRSSSRSGSKDKQDEGRRASRGR